MEFKIGDKVKIPTQSTANIGNYKQACNQMAGYKLDYLVITDLNTCKNSNWEVGLDMDSGKTLFANAFNFIDIELYEEEFPEKWWIYPKTISEIEAVCKWFDKNHNNEEVGVFYSGQKLKTGYTNAFQKGNVYFEHKPEEATEITFDQFKKYIFKEETAMKNLLETEFVIENCTLSQRLAIKAYCDEKKITYVDLEVPSYKTLTFRDGKFKGFINSVVQRDVITFSELIQFLDKYQPEPEFKVGDFVYFDGKHHQAGPYLLKEKISDGQFKDSNNETRDIKESKGAYRHATPEEIKKWKEENEIKLPEINGFKGKANKEFIVYGDNCAKLKISWFKNIGDVSSFLNIGENRTIRSIKLNSDVEITIAHIEQIKKFIEHNKL